MSHGMDRRILEQQFHDRQAAERAERFRSGCEDLVFSDEAYLDHETWIRPAFNSLGQLRGQHVLDYGCGHGMAAVVMARRGAVVAAFDLSPGYVAEARSRAAANQVNVDCTIADGEQLPYPDSSFDAIWGNAILHHLDLMKAGRELKRVLKPGGIAVFCEPWGGNPLLAFARRRLPYPGKDRTPDEVPLTSKDLVTLRSIFPNLTMQGFQFFGMFRRIWPGGRLCRLLDRLDERLLAFWPGLAHWCRYAVITMKRET